MPIPANEWPTRTGVQDRTAPVDRGSLWRSLQVHLIPWRWILPMTWQVETQRLMTFTPKRFSTSVPAPTAVRSTMHEQKDSHGLSCRTSDEKSDGICCDQCAGDGTET